MKKHNKLGWAGKYKIDLPEVTKIIDFEHRFWLFGVDCKDMGSAPGMCNLVFTSQTIPDFTLVKGDFFWYVGIALEAEGEEVTLCSPPGGFQIFDKEEFTVQYVYPPEPEDPYGLEDGEDLCQGDD